MQAGSGRKGAGTNDKRSPRVALPAPSLLSRLVQRALAVFGADSPARSPLRFEALEPRILLSGNPIAPPRIDGSLDVAGETDRYSLTLTDDLRVVFDSLTSNSNIRWSLDGPRGNLVSSRPFNQSDSGDLGGNVAYDLPAGDYMFTVDGVADATGAYGFRLIDINAAQDLTPGTPVTGELSPANETDAYKFSAVAGQRYFFDRFANSSDAYWRLLDPFGRTVAGPTPLNSDLGELTLGLDGSYTLLIEGRSTASGSGSYSLNVVALQDPAPVAMAVGDDVRGRITGAGLRNAYTFSVASPQQVLFDSLTNNGSLTWSLTGPLGNLIAGRTLQQSDSWDVSGNPLLTLAAGNYTLTIDGTGDAVGDFAFRLLALTGATAMTPGTPLTDTLGDAGALANLSRITSGAPLGYAAGEPNLAYAADGSARFITVADSTSLKPAALTVEAWVYRDPTVANYGGVLMKSSNSGWGDGYGLANHTDGRIHFFVNNYNNNEVSADLPANTWTHVAGTYDGSTLKLYVNGALVTSKAYAATLNNSAQPLRIGSGAGGNYPWKGRIDEARVWGVARSAADIAANYNHLLTGAEAGLAGYWRFDEAGSLSFTDLSPNANTGTMTAPATETRLYKFDATAGARYFFDAQALTGGDTTYRLFGPSGAVVLGPQSISTDSDVFTAAAAGTYTLAVEGRVYNTGPSTWRINLQPVSDVTSALTLGERVNASIAHPGQQQKYTFTASAGQQVVFDSLTNSSSFTWSLAGPLGVQVSNRSFSSSDTNRFSGTTALLLTAGNYTLTVDGTGDTAGAFAFRLLDLAAGETLAYNTATTGTLDPGNLTRIFSLAATAGDSVTFDWQSSTGTTPYWRLIDPTGALVFGPFAFDTDTGPHTLKLSGNYTLLIEGQVSATAAVAYGFTATLNGNTPIPAPTGSAMAVGVRVDGSIDVSGEIDDFVFTVSAPGRYVFDALTPNSSSFRWTLISPRGTEVSNRFFTASDSVNFGGTPVIDLPLAGTYQLRINTVSSVTGAYAFRLLDLAGASTVTPGTVVSSTLSPATETEVYKFDATAGQRLFFDVQALSPNNSSQVYWRLLDPFGRQVFGPNNFFVNNDPGVVTLDTAGSYTVLVEGRIRSTGTFDYSFNILPVVDPVPVALTLGDLVTGSIDAATRSTTYNFTLAGTTALYFDALVGDNNLNWTLTGATGTIASRAFGNSDSFEFGSASPLMLLGAGAYTLVVAGTNFTGSYAFRLSDPRASATAIGLGATVIGALDPANESDFFSLDATAGDRLFFDVRALSPNNGNWVSWRLFDPQGAQVFGPTGLYFNNDVDGVAIAATGTYLLVVEGRIWTPANGVAKFDYSFNVGKVVDQQAALVIGNVTSGTINQPGQRAVYNFSLTAAQSLLFDALAPNNNTPDFRWSLTGPRGAEVSGRQLYYSEAQEFGSASPLLNLIAGDYQLIIDPESDQQGAFAFRLLDVASATTLTSNTVVSGAFNPSNETDVYRFTATAGTRYYLNRQSLSAGSSDWFAWRSSMHSDARSSARRISATWT